MFYGLMPEIKMDWIGLDYTGVRMYHALQIRKLQDYLRTFINYTRRV